MTGKYTKSVHPLCKVCCEILTYVALSFIGLIKYLFSLLEVEDNHLAFLSNNICQDPIEDYFGCQRQWGGTSDNPNVVEFCHNMQALRIVDSFCRPSVRGNWRRKRESESSVPNMLQENQFMIPLSKWPRLTTTL